MARRGEPRYYAFDLLWLNGIDLRSRPLLDRKRRLHRLIPANDSHLLYVEHLDGDGAQFFKLVCEQDLEGIIHKPKTSPYPVYLDQGQESQLTERERDQKLRVSLRIEIVLPAAARIGRQSDILVALLASTTYASAQFTFSSLDFPGSTLTTGRDINNHGEIVGAYRFEPPRHAYLLKAGKFTPLAPSTRFYVTPPAHPLLAPHQDQDAGCDAPPKPWSTGVRFRTIVAAADD